MKSPFKSMGMWGSTLAVLLGMAEAYTGVQLDESCKEQVTQLLIALGASTAGAGLLAGIGRLRATDRIKL